MTDTPDLDAIEARTLRDPFTGEMVSIRDDLVHRLRGKYASGPTLPNGEPEFGWRQMGDPSPIKVEAAERIENLCASIRAKDAEIAMLRENTKVCSQWIEGRLIACGTLKDWPTLQVSANAILMRLNAALKEQRHDAG